MIKDGITTHFDEILAIACLGYIVKVFYEKKLSVAEKRIVLLLFGIVVIGVLSSIIHPMRQGVYPIMVDVLAFIKTIVVFVAFRHYTSNNISLDVCRRLSKFAKVILILAVVLAFIFQIYDFRDTDYARVFLLRPFALVNNNGIQTYWFLTGCLAFVLATEKRSIKYIIMYFIATAITMSTLVLCGDALLLFFLFYNRRKDKIKIRTLIIIVIGASILSFSAIQEYIFDSSAPRSYFLQYGIKTGNRFFPLGAGFATYGSDMAAKHYSPLYYEYGFQTRYGLTPSSEGAYLYDNYFAMIIGQFGWIALLLFIAMFFYIFKLLNKRNKGMNIKALNLAVFFVIVSSMVVSATSKSYFGVWMFAILGLCSKIDYGKLRKENENSSDNANKIE
ncbi:MAG: hypothetical protein E7254_04730 [Lachnospiraceae bacterium]|nr:hypothetical protein [Lachnospiraceae bacterium]